MVQLSRTRPSTAPRAILQPVPSPAQLPANTLISARSAPSPPASSPPRPPSASAAPAPQRANSHPPSASAPALSRALCSAAFTCKTANPSRPEPRAPSHSLSATPSQQKQNPPAVPNTSTPNRPVQSISGPARRPTAPPPASPANPSRSPPAPAGPLLIPIPPLPGRRRAPSSTHGHLGIDHPFIRPVRHNPDRRRPRHVQPHHLPRTRRRILRPRPAPACRQLPNTHKPRRLARLQFLRPNVLNRPLETRYVFNFVQPVANLNARIFA